MLASATRQQVGSDVDGCGGARLPRLSNLTSLLCSCFLKKKNLPCSCIREKNFSYPSLVVLLFFSLFFARITPASTIQLSGGLIMIFLATLLPC
jgi:hypothetical protein